MIPDRIREARKQLKLTQDDLAKHLGVQRAVISKYETGLIAPSVDQLKTIAKTLNVSIAYLLGDTDSPQSFQNSTNYLDLINNTTPFDPRLFTQRLRQLRAEHGFTIEQAAAASDLGTSQYQAIEEGFVEPCISDFAAIADCFGVSLDYLAGRSNHFVIK